MPGNILPLKWKIYQVSNYLQMVVSAVVFMMMISLAYHAGIPRDMSWLLLFGALILILTITANIVNLVILYKYFPDKMPSGRLETAHWVFLITNTLISLGLLFVVIIGFMEEFISPAEPGESVGKILVLFFFFYWLLEVYILTYQFRVMGFLKRNYEHSLASLIESIGT